ncbi:MAG: hypothetical protein V2B18_21930 [Pseudomonadota bacterium]
MLHRDEIVDVLRREADRSARQGIPFGVIIATAGPSEGNARNEAGASAGPADVRNRMGRVMAGVLRSYDSVGLYGRMTWLIVVPGCDRTGTKRVVRRLRESLASAASELAGIGCRLSVRFLISALKGADIHSLDPILDAADKAAEMGSEIPW